MNSIYTIAKAAHEVNRAYCTSIGDNTQPAWDDAPDWQKESAIAGVKYHLDNEGVTPEMSHESWLKQKADNGWKYGPVKDPEKKEHPCFVAYDQLPKEQQAKDLLFKSVVDALRGQVAEAVDLSPYKPSRSREPLLNPHGPAVGEIVKAAIRSTKNFDIKDWQHRDYVVDLVKSLTSVDDEDDDED